MHATVNWFRCGSFQQQLLTVNPLMRRGRLKLAAEITGEHSLIQAPPFRELEPLTNEARFIGAKLTSPIVISHNGVST